MIPAMTRSALPQILSVVALCLALPATGRAMTDSAASEPALEIERGSVARQQVVALGRDVVVDGEALADVAAINGSAHVSGSIGGDLLVLGMDGVLIKRGLIGKCGDQARVERAI